MGNAGFISSTVCLTPPSALCPAKELLISIHALFLQTLALVPINIRLSLRPEIQLRPATLATGLFILDVESSQVWILRLRVWVSGYIGLQVRLCLARWGRKWAEHASYVPLGRAAFEISIFRPESAMSRTIRTVTTSGPIQILHALLNYGVLALWACHFQQGPHPAFGPNILPLWNSAPERPSWCLLRV